MPLTNTRKAEGSDANWAAQVEATSKSDQRTKPWEAVVEATNVDKPEGDLINVDANPQAACDISVSA